MEEQKVNNLGDDSEQAVKKARSVPAKPLPGETLKLQFDSPTEYFGKGKNE